MAIWVNRCPYPAQCDFWMGDGLCELEIIPESGEKYECPARIIDDDEDWDEEMEEHFDLDDLDDPNLNDQFCGDSWEYP